MLDKAHFVLGIFMCGCYPGFSPDRAAYLTAPDRAILDATEAKRQRLSLETVELTPEERAQVLEPFKNRPPFVPFEGAFRAVCDLVTAAFGSRSRSTLQG